MIKRLSLFFILIFIITPAFSQNTVQNNPRNDAIRDSEQKLNTLQMRIGNIKNSLTTMNPQIKNPNNRQLLTNILASVNELSNSIDNLEKQIAIIKQTLSSQSAPNVSSAAPGSRNSINATAPSQINDKVNQLEQKVNAIEKNLKNLTDLIKNQSSSSPPTLTENTENMTLDKNSSDAVVKKTHEALNKEIANGSFSVDEDQNIVKMKISNDILFQSGAVSLSQKGEEILKKVASVLKPLDNKDIYIIGHSDNVPISDSLKVFYPTNWELSTGRGIMVARYLTEELAIDPHNIIAGGRSFYDPITSNNTWEGRQKNRRTEIWIYPKISQGNPIALEQESNQNPTDNSNMQNSLGEASTPN
jgi:chemotaxis protein MotB